MRDWTGAPEILSVEDPQAKQVVTRIDYYLRDLSRGVGRIQQGEVPDGSGTLITDVKISDIYLVLLGRNGGQAGHGGKNAGESLLLASTTDATKGSIFFGDASAAAFDETNTRFGIGTSAATAKVHINVGAPSFVTTIRPQADSPANGWVDENGNQPVFAHIGGTTTATYGRGIEGTGAGIYTASATGVAPATFSGWNVGFSARVLTGPPSTSLISVNMDSGGFSWFQSGTQAITTGAFQDFLIPVNSVSATAAVFSNLRWGISGGLSPGFGELQVANLRLELPVAGSIAADTLQKWQTSATANQLDFGDSGASTVDMKMSGNAPLFLGVGDGSSGLRIYSSASTAFLEAGTTAQGAENLTLGGLRQSLASSVLISAASATASNMFRAAQVGIGAAPSASPAIHLDVTGRTRWVSVTGSISGSTSNLDVGASTVFRLSATGGPFAIGGITNGVDGRVLFLVNDGAQPYLLKHDTTGTAANRLYSPTLSDVSVAPNDTYQLTYDGGISRWRIQKYAAPAGQETISGAWTFNGTVVIDMPDGGSFEIDGSGSGTLPQIVFKDVDTNNVMVLMPAAMSSVAATISLPDIGGDPSPHSAGTLVTKQTTDLLENKTMAKATTILLSDTQTAGVYFADDSARSKKFRFICSNITASGQCAIDMFTTASRKWTASGDYDARFSFTGVSAVASASGTTQGTLGYTALTGISASLGATTLASAVPGGLYRVPWYIKITTAGDAEPTDSLAPAVSWNDGSAQTRTLIPHNVTAAADLDGTIPVSTINRSFSGSIVVSAAASSNISIATTLVNGGATNPVYSLAATVEAI